MNKGRVYYLFVIICYIFFRNLKKSQDSGKFHENIRCPRTIKSLFATFFLYIILTYFKFPKQLNKNLRYLKFLLLNIELYMYNYINILIRNINLYG